MKNLSALLVASAMLAACGDNTPVQTVQWYKEHDAERQEMLAKCKNDRNAIDASPNCVNAEQAQVEKRSSRRGVVRMGLGASSKQEE